MKDIYQVLRGKEQRLVEVKKEIEALHLVYRLLQDETETFGPPGTQASAAETFGVNPKAVYSISETTPKQFP
jgi:hypothetical protein